jgi:hypothetical protein
LFRLFGSAKQLRKLVSANRSLILLFKVRGWSTEVWNLDIVIAMLLEAIVTRRVPSIMVIVGGCITLFGAFLATDAEVPGSSAQLQQRWFLLSSAFTSFCIILSFRYIVPNCAI